MYLLNFDKANIKAQWTQCKSQFRERFWDDAHKAILQEVKQMMEDLLEEEFNFNLGALPYQRTNTRRGKRNGFRRRSLETPYGRIAEIRIPRARDLDIRFSLFDRWQQVSDSVLDSMTQAYLLGRSASSAQRIIKAFGHSHFSRTFLQKLTHRFEQNLQDWLNRPITKSWPYLFLDGMVVNIREVDQLKQYCVLWALGMDEHHNTEILGFLVLKTESQEGTERLLRDLVGRGLKRPKLIMSDASRAIANAASMVFPHTPQQGCIFHKVKATGKYIQNSKNKQSFLKQAADIYLKAISRKSLLKRLSVFKKRWRKKEPEALKSLLANFDRTVTYLNFPKDHWSWIRTNNPMENFIGRIRVWTARFGYFQGKGNLQLALFTYLCHKNNQLVPKINPNEINQPDLKDTLSIA